MIRIKYFDPDEPKKDIISGLKALAPVEPPIVPEEEKKPKKKKKEESISAPLSELSLTSKIKEKNKRKKSKSKWESIYSKYVPGNAPSAEDDEITLEEFVKRLEAAGDDEYDGDDIINEQSRGYGRLKKEENVYKKEFAEELTLLYNLLNESTHFGKKLDRKFDAMEGNKTRGINKFSNDLAMSIISVKGNKLSILKEIASIKKTIADLKFKESKGKEEGGGSMERLASSYLKGIMTQGRGDFIKNMGSAGYDDYTSEDDHVTSAHLNSYEQDDIDEVISRRLNDEGNPFRSKEGSLNIEMETLGIRTMIKYNLDTGEWYFFNVDRDGQRVDGYPLPSADKKIKWSEDYTSATDEWNGIYKVLSVTDEFF